MKCFIAKPLYFSVAIVCGMLLSGCGSPNETQLETKMQEQPNNKQENLTNPQEDTFMDVQDLQFDTTASEEPTLRDYEENDEIAPDYPEVMLESAVRSGDVDEVKKWLNEGATPLDWNWKEAIGKGMQPSQVKPEIVKLLVEAGVDPKDFERPKSVGTGE